MPAPPLFYLLQHRLLPPPAPNANQLRRHILATPSTNNVSPPSALTRVFAIPELLEQVLLDLAVQSSHYICGLEPATTMARCQSVNRTFHAAVRQSLKIQRLVQNVPEPNTRQPLGPLALRPLDQRLEWLFGKLSLTLTNYCRYRGKDCHYRLLAGYRPPFYSRTPRFVRFRQRHNAPEASWRRVKCHYQQSICYGAIEFGFIAKVYGTIEYGPGSTLDTVFDSLCAILDKAKRYNGVYGEDGDLAEGAEMRWILARESMYALSVAWKSLRGRVV
ncbi:uncharacterized protein CLAFUR5_07087 [Fulvia fulva]|uniref:Uncharacterized protein n=1 Tax=Passalora fulva TaxID=5499 RepID=A0A9Q8PB68_PASFU|nr:uncharacterized protein CLAFUR5_07087 [Fulvia fulva]KAK4622539.1 hypothetical protein CLAFUR0_06957 [Fulvia fulva]UJO19264.1 hypothetical protein CLAFUR5_07087 [Fulvia fulva]